MRQGCLEALSAIVLVLLSSELARSDGDVMRVHFVDVGQGSATLIEFPCAAVLIDTGGERLPKEEWIPAKFDGSEELLKYLRRFFEARSDLGGRLELLVLTHPHIDHTRGSPAVINEFRPKNVVFNGQLSGSGGDGQRFARDYARDEGVGGWYVLERRIKKSTGQTNAIIDPIAKCKSTDPRIRVLWGKSELDDRWERGGEDRPTRMPETPLTAILPP